MFECASLFLSGTGQQKAPGTEPRALRSSRAREMGRSSRCGSHRHLCGLCVRFPAGGMGAQSMLTIGGQSICNDDAGCGLACCGVHAAPRRQRHSSGSCLLVMVTLALSTLLSLSTSEITGICARWSNRRITGSEAFGLLQLKQLGPSPYPGANQADRMDAAVSKVCRPRLMVPGT